MAKYSYSASWALIDRRKNYQRSRFRWLNGPFLALTMRQWVYPSPHYRRVVLAAADPDIPRIHLSNKRAIVVILSIYPNDECYFHTYSILIWCMQHRMRILMNEHRWILSLLHTLSLWVLRVYSNDSIRSRLYLTIRNRSHCYSIDFIME